MNTNCNLCNKWIFNATGHFVTCDECTKQREKLGDDTFDWLMRLIEGRIEKAIEEHSSAYEHERGSGYY